MNTIPSTFAFVCLALSLPVQAANLEISGVQTQIAGTSTDVTGSGGSANFASGTVVGDFAVFDISSVDDSTGQTTSFGHLRVTYSADNGGVGSDIMIARTTDSQDLTDSGTLSVLMNIGGDNRTADLTFDWFTVGSFSGGVEQTGSSLINTPINYTSFDIDFQQLNAFERDDVAQYTLDGNTQLTATDDGTDIFFEDSGADSSFGDPTTAYQVLTRDQAASHRITMGKQSSNGNALFMFEFRDPSDVTTFTDPDTTVVPEPTSSLLFLSALTGFLLRRSRRR